jgi:hypothetical protein
VNRIGGSLVPVAQRVDELFTLDPFWTV